MFAGFIGVAAIGLVSIILPDASTRAQPTTHDASRAQPARAEAETEEVATLRQLADWEREEQLTRAREDVEILELQLGARRAQVQKAGLRLELERSLQAHTERIRKKGLAAASDERRAELDVMEAESQLALRKAEFAEVEMRFNQARRRVASLERRGESGLGIIEAMGQDIDDLRDRLERMEKKFDLLQAETNRLRDDARRLAKSN